jgi:hypothetical protein
MTHIFLIVIVVLYFWMLVIACILMVSIMRQLRVARQERAYVPATVPPQVNQANPALKRITDELVAVRLDARSRRAARPDETGEQIVLTIESETEKSGERDNRDRYREMQAVLRRYAARPPGRR